MVRIGRARRAARRAPAHPLRRERRGRRVLARHVRLPADGVPRAHRLVHRPHVGGPLRDARRATRSRRLGAARHRRGPLPEQQPDPVVGHRPGRATARRRRARRARRRRLVVGRQRVAVAGGPPGDAAGQAARRRRRRARRGWRWRWRRSAARRASVAAARSACSSPARSPTSPCGGSTGPIVRRRDGRPDRGLAALRPGVGVAHDRPRPLRRARRPDRAPRPRRTSCAPTPRTRRESSVSSTDGRRHCRHSSSRSASSSWPNSPTRRCSRRSCCRRAIGGRWRSWSV